MKSILVVLVIISSTANSFADTKRIMQKASCTNTVREDLISYLHVKYQTFECAIRDAEMLGLINCEDQNGTPTGVFHNAVNCIEKLQIINDRQYTKITCNTSALISCKF